MDPNTLSPSDPTFSQAMDQLARLEAEDAEPAAEPTTAPEPTPASVPPGEHTPETEIVEGQPPAPKPGEPGAPAAAEPGKTAEPQSAFSKNQRRLEGGWKKLNEEKTAIESERAKIKSERDAFVAEQAKFQAERAKATQSKPPEYYENGAVEMDKQAAQAEARGDYPRADELKATANLARKHAAELRANPPKPAPTTEQVTEQFKAQQKEWWAKAGIDFPAVTKPGPEQAALASLIKSEPSIAGDPKGMYYGARLVCAETAAARVPTLDKELVELRAKVKELTGKLSLPSGGSAIGAPSGPKSFEQLSEEEQEEQLRSEAAGRAR